MKGKSHRNSSSLVRHPQGPGDEGARQGQPLQQPRAAPLTAAWCPGGTLQVGAAPRAHCEQSVAAHTCPRDPWSGSPEVSLRCSHLLTWHMRKEAFRLRRNSMCFTGWGPALRGRMPDGLGGTAELGLPGQRLSPGSIPPVAPLRCQGCSRLSLLRAPAVRWRLAPSHSGAWGVAGV